MPVRGADVSLVLSLLASGRFRQLLVKVRVGDVIGEKRRMGHYDNGNMGNNQGMARRQRVGLSTCEKRESEKRAVM